MNFVFIEFIFVILIVESVDAFDVVIILCICNGVISLYAVPSKLRCICSIFSNMLSVATAAVSTLNESDWLATVEGLVPLCG